jgi:hypothetical protein
MKIKELFGKTITQVYAIYGMEQGWLDTADCFIELDQSLIIGFPYFYNDEVWIRELPGDAQRLFDKAEGPVINKKIIDLIYFDEPDTRECFLLEDGSVITETNMSPHGTGHAGLNYFQTIQKLIDFKESDFRRLSETDDPVSF